MSAALQQATASLHPLFAEILGNFAAQPLMLARAEYLTALRTLDWQHEFSDDERAYRRGRQQMQRIRELQPLVDPDTALFNAYRPGRHGDAAL